MRYNIKNSVARIALSVMLVSFAVACDDSVLSEAETSAANASNEEAAASGRLSTASMISESIVMVIDEESIDNGNQPNDFSKVDVNDQLADIGQRRTLQYFADNVGQEIELFTGEVGDEGWHALKTIPSSWISTGPTNVGVENFLQAGPGLGGGEDDREVLLDKIPNVTPLRARALSMLTNKTVLAVVYDGDVSINYGPLNGNLQGANLGLVAFTVLQVTKRTDGSSGSLPRVTIRIESVELARTASLKLFANAPKPHSSSEPFDITPPTVIPAIHLVDAR